MFPLPSCSHSISCYHSTLIFPFHSLLPLYPHVPIPFPVTIIPSCSHSIPCYHVILYLHVGEFTVETKNAGIGTLLIRVHGIKHSFKIEAAPRSDTDPRTLLAQYHPRIPGEYTIFVRWSGSHVPGSPFTVKIKRRPGEEVPIGEQSQY